LKITHETFKLYSGVLRIFTPNVVEIEAYNFELYRFKVGAFFETQCRLQYRPTALRLRLVGSIATIVIKVTVPTALNAATIITRKLRRRFTRAIICTANIHTEMLSLRTGLSLEAKTLASNLETKIIKIYECSLG